jgi:hypothetical protein
VEWRSWDAPPPQTQECKLQPPTIAALAAAHGVDSVMVVFSTWDYGAGFNKTGIVNTSFKLYSKEGALLVEGSYGAKRSLGAFPSGEPMVTDYTEAAMESIRLVAQHLASGVP